MGISPLAAPRDAIAQLGLAQSSNRQFWMSGDKTKQPLPDGLRESVPKLIKRLGLEGFFYAIT